MGSGMVRHAERSPEMSSFLLHTKSTTSIKDFGCIAFSCWRRVSRPCMMLLAVAVCHVLDWACFGCGEHAASHNSQPVHAIWFNPYSPCR